MWNIAISYSHLSAVMAYPKCTDQTTIVIILFCIISTTIQAIPTESKHRHSCIIIHNVDIHCLP